MTTMTDTWQRVCGRGDIPEDDVIAVLVDGHEIALYDVDGDVFATDNLCTHGQAKLSDGFLEDGEIECPLHQGRFCVKSGKARSAPLTTDIGIHAVRVEGEDVFVALGA